MKPFFTDTTVEHLLDRSAEIVRDIISAKWNEAVCTPSGLRDGECRTDGASMEGETVAAGETGTLNHGVKEDGSALAKFSGWNSIFFEGAGFSEKAAENSAAGPLGRFSENPPDSGQVEVMPNPGPAPKDEVLDTLDGLVEALKTGKEISGLRDKIQRLVSNQESKAELVAGLAMAHDFDRFSRYARARASLEDILLNAAVDRTLTPTQALAFLKIAQEQAEIILNRIRSGAANIQDLIALLNKADYALQLHDAEIQKKFSSTSPQGREIIRRLAHRLHKIESEKSNENKD